jgi:hypothetical protein
MAAAAFVALLAALTMALLPISGRTTTWTWTRHRATETAIELSAGAPAEIDTSIPCQAIRQRRYQLTDLEILRFAGSRELGLWSTGPEIWVDSSGTRIAGLPNRSVRGLCRQVALRRCVRLGHVERRREAERAAWLPRVDGPWCGEAWFQIDGVHIAKELRLGSRCAS